MYRHGEYSHANNAVWDGRFDKWITRSLFIGRYGRDKIIEPAPALQVPGPCPIPAPPAPPVPAAASWPAQAATSATTAPPLSVEAAQEALAEAKASAKEEAAAERAALAAAEAEQVRCDRREALRQRIEYESGLARTTKQLLADIAALLLHHVRHISPGTYYADYATELQPLAKTYGCKIIPVGDRTLGTVVVLP